MTDQELKDLVANLFINHQKMTEESERSYARIRQEAIEKTEQVRQEIMKESARVREEIMAESARVCQKITEESERTQARIRQEMAEESTRIRKESMEESTRIRKESMEESARIRKESIEEFARIRKESIEESTRIRKESAAELALSHQELDKAIKETDKAIKETDKVVKELGKQIGGIARKFGSFTEGLALPSMTKILSEQFGMTTINPSVRVRDKQGNEQEIDVLAYTNGQINTAIIVEVKSHLREEGIEQLLQQCRSFRVLFPELADKKLYGILAAVDANRHLQQKVLAQGLYFAKIHDEQFSLCVPKDFKPFCFTTNH